MKLEADKIRTIGIRAGFLLAIIAMGIVAFRSSGGAYESEGQPFSVEVIAQQEDVVWGFDFLPDGRIVFTERDGQLRILDPSTRSVQTVQGAPAVVQAGQGGLLDVRVHPEFDKNGWIYLTYSEKATHGMTTALGRGRLEGTELKDYRKLFSAFEPNGNNIHFGSRIEFDGAGKLFISVGDRNERHNAQDLRYHNGKILRLNEDGSAPVDNPFANNPDAKPEIWSYGHRNPQGLAKHPITGELWESEFGPRGGDEINVIRPGANYGWPVITYGREYWGPKIGEGTEKAGMEQPVAYYVPSISPSGIAFYFGDAFPRWKGNLFVANLSGQHLRRLVIDDNNKVVKQEELLNDLGVNFRHVRTGPEGFLYFSTDDGKIARLVPNL
ncbi:PQQ-dependent sugar dehydrogenase [Methylocaldum sp. GT1BB]|uniref:PQQ-dependent sugar dehydrogenase n=1 Tax=Methylocaldum sp. GT1BB TaxID=3438963 RepID=UPI003DA1A614